jgi:beta-galactosidase
MPHLLKLFHISGISFFAFIFFVAHAENITRSIKTWDNDWKFIQTDTTGAEAKAYNDSSWKLVTLPHDWSIAGPFDINNPTGGAGGFLPAGIGWYRKSFTLKRIHEQKLSIEFDGVMANSDVWINEHHLGKRPYGYSSFSYDLTPYLSEDGNNLIAVRVDNAQQPASRWYSGSGIYRHVRLVSTPLLHLGHWSTFVSTRDATKQTAHLNIETLVVNEADTAKDVSVNFEVKDPANDLSITSIKSHVTRIEAHTTCEIKECITLSNPTLWSLENPYLYTLKTSVSANDNPDSCDCEVTPVGIRTIRFDASQGFFLNDKNLKLKGVCLHDDGSAFGAAVPLGLWEIRLNALKKLGVNAIRTAHNPPAPEFLNLCDQLGFLVMDESFDCWTVGKNLYDYHLVFEAWNKIDIRDMVLRDRNHPSIVLWSTGNEIHDTPKTELAYRILKDLVDIIHKNDPTRPTTQALFRPNVSHDYDNGLADLLDVVGTNYRYNELLAAHETKPTRKIIGTENGHELPAWLAVRDNPEYAGEFIWSGIDYLGESRTWPIIANPSGLLDRTSIPHPDGYIFQSWWSDKPTLYLARRVAPTPPRPTDPGYETTPVPRKRTKTLLADWNPKTISPHLESIEVYSNCDEVELFLNKKSLGSKSLSSDLSPRTWSVEYTPGELVAVGKNKNVAVYTTALVTQLKPASIKLSAIYPKRVQGWDNIICIMAEVVDGNGTLNTNASNLIKFTSNIPASIVAVDSGDNASHESFYLAKRKAYEGRCVAYVRLDSTKQKVIVTASAEGLSSTQLEMINP